MTVLNKHYFCVSQFSRFPHGMPATIQYAFDFIIWMCPLLLFYDYLFRSFIENINREQLWSTVPHRFYDILDSIDVNCAKILENDETAIRAAENMTYSSLFIKEIILREEQRCPWIRNLFGFDCKPTSKAERKFPLAYGLLVYTNAIQVLFMLSAFYRLQNEYCIAVSGSASKDFKFLMKVVDECFDNVYVMERPPVKWGSFEILNSTFACLEVLSHSDRPWRYYQYLSGFDVPLKTNREMIEIFKMWNNTVNARYMRYEKHRLNQKREEDSPLPIIKASVSAALPRSAVDKIVKSKETRKLLKFLQGTTIPDESFWGTLTGNTDKFPMPGGINAEKLLEYQEEHNRTRQHMVKKFMKISPRMSNYLSRYQLWRRRNDTCRGKYVHGSCVYGLKDLADLMKQPHLVAHKMYIDFQPAALFCALKTIRIRERDRFTLNVKPYSEIPHVQLSAGVTFDNLTHPLWLFY
ncbi:hypothetical protein RB195_004165 [Necator americanus]|uniref:Core-2/I-Branching enzyme n=1 Tax=Necator americanus TaxID=51031 RepID=A0ABR1BL89_NECAM